mmetsp:Transcript_26171/g.36140  ORF Transcript_26171/g.36140 Transcript_26171/m.36140 type:complete len:364 (-) Transcript_26171:39-1130(-)|eukprot:CAMPEP_0196582264 /NCGR_PEP_ID=MMETSP1081-20130531/38351_1 /TAXON_ID=36882 /ORGANISM="Pyramimonas amylifera, Strain CCMP720" /LENGTH=363 /DNA_ID=CAMNT_0041902779 /DNA_START=38 /DNA_END=1129 /DNA_ORIENTATION=-
MEVWWGSLLPTPTAPVQDPAVKKINELNLQLKNAQTAINDLSLKVKVRTSEAEVAKAKAHELRSAFFEATATSPRNSLQTEPNPKNDSKASSGSLQPSADELKGLDQGVVRCTLEDGVATLTMQDAARLNCLSQELVAALLAALDAVQRLKARVVVLKAKPGVKVWSAGHNLKEFCVTGEPTDMEQPVKDLLGRIKEYPVPVIAAVEGSVWGAACDLVVCCDMVLATPSTTFALTASKIGVPYGTCGMSHFLGALPIHVLKEMFFTAKPLTSEVALRLGLLNEVVSSNNLYPAALRMAKDVASRAPFVINMLKKELGQLSDLPVSGETSRKAESLRWQAYNSYDRREGTAAFLEKRPPLFKGE